MKKIKLGKKNLFALVDDDMFDELNKYHWWSDSLGYAIRQISRGKFVHMHRIINNTPQGMDTDHINRNKLDNRRENLRTATRSLNMINTGLRNDNTSGHKGIDFYKRVKRWRSRIGAKSLGYFKNLEDAILARQKAERSMGWTT